MTDCITGTEHSIVPVCCLVKQETCAILIDLQSRKNKILWVEMFVCLFCCFSPKSTAMVMAGWSVKLTSLFPGQA